MTDPSINPALVGIWLQPGQPQTYEITADGAYHIADPEEPLRFEEDGAVMIWGDRRFARTEGAGETPIGTWREEETGDGWDFASDQGLTILSTEPGEERAFTGIWALRDDGRSLWTREKRADLTCDGAHLTYAMVSGEVYRYGYSVDDDVLSLLDPDTWEELTRYISANLVHETMAAI
jgi:hypothetical protein